MNVAVTETCVLDEDEDTLAIGAEGEAVAVVVRDGDGEAGRVEEVAAEAQPARVLAGDNLEDLRNLDDRSASDDSEAEHL